MTDAVQRLSAALADRYAIERELGQGGMATVYLAEDLKHHRKVALKVLRPEIAVTVGAGRFSREIEVAARLQHPNILPLLDSGEAAGFFFYVMPYVEGESLRDRLERSGEFAIPDVVRILMEVADALSHAHAHGVVHRDIKPGNILLSGRHALVADFGVAKAVTEATGHQLLTSAGVALGTPMYMAPEQALADPHQDHRVDIYALGVLGYELLTGRAPFAATTGQEMLAAHVTAVPEPVERYRPTVSPVLAAVVMKCLAKKPADRWQTAEELLQHLEPLATPSGGTTPAQTRPVIALGNVPHWGKWAAGVAAVAVVALVVSRLLEPKPLDIALSDITPVTSDPGVEFQPAISPDGNEVAYVAGPISQPRLYVRSAVSFAGGAALRLGDSTPGSDWLPSWSPDGQLVRFWSCPGRLEWWSTGCAWKETVKLGGAVRSSTLPSRARSSRFLAWSLDGARVAFAVGDTIFLSTATDTVPLRVLVDSTQSKGAGLHSLAWSPDGKRIAYVKGNAGWLVSGNIEGSSISIVGADGGAARTVVGDEGEYLNVSPAWLDARHLLFVSNRDGPRGVYVVEVGPQGRRGEPRLVPGVGEPHSISYGIRARRLVFAKLTLRQNIWSYPLGRAGPISIGEGTQVTTGNQVIERSEVSPDGRWLTFDGNRRGTMDIYKMRIGGSDAVAVTSLPGDEYQPRWSPSGTEIAFSAAVRGSAGHYQIMVAPADGGSPVALTNSRGMNFHPSWSPDGLSIAFSSTRTGTWRLWLLSRDSLNGPWHEATQLSDVPCVRPSWVPDDSAILCVNPGWDFIAFSSKGRVLSRHTLVPNGELTSLGEGVFSRDRRTYYQAAAGRDGRRGVWAVPAAGGAPRLIIAFDDPALAAGVWLSVGPDRLYLTVAQYESDIWVARLRW